MYGYIYLTTNTINNKKYIGQHKSEKFDESYKGSGKTLVKAFEKYGFENFTTEILEWCEDQDTLNEKEIYYIALYDATSSDEFYNIARGGEGHTCDPWNKGQHGVQEWTPAMEEAFEKGRHLPASEKLKDHLRRRSEWVDYTPEYRAKLSKAQSENRTVNDGVKNIIVKEWELDEWLAKPGISRGRVKQESSTTNQQRGVHLK